jgi:hypothetical protein
MDAVGLSYMPLSPWFIPRIIMAIMAVHMSTPFTRQNALASG